MKRFAIVYQCGIANVFNITPDRCQLCLDVPGKDGLGRKCKGCNGTGSKPEVRRRRLLQGTFSTCEDFMRGAVAAGVEPAIYHCDVAGDGELLAESKSYA